MIGNDKIKSISVLADLLARVRVDKKKIVLCYGVFDTLHIGHIRYFEDARRMGDILVVIIIADRYVDKGLSLPTFAESIRAEAVASLNSVDYVAINQSSRVEDILRVLCPDVYVKGLESKKIDQEGSIDRVKEVLHEINATLAYTENIVFNSTDLINRYLSNLPDEINEYLRFFRKRYKLDEVLQILDKMSSLNVLVIGDTILDEYQYCDVIGKSSKDPTLAMKYMSKDIFAGGVLAVANHVANFAKKVQLVTVLGERDSFEEFIRSQLHPGISPYFVVQPNAPTMIKRRFIDGYSINKLFEIYVMDDSGLPKGQDIKLCTWVKDCLQEYDLVIAADFGHGTISNNMVQTLVDYSKFLAVNTQANAGNRGFHTISRYPSVDYACIAEHELRLETRVQNGNLWPIMDEIVKKLGCSQLVVTRGRNGCAVIDKNGGFLQVPAFAKKTVDRVGAGDAFLSISSLAAVQGIPNEVLGFIGNVVGALAVEILGNKKSIDKLNVKEYVSSLMKIPIINNWKRRNKQFPESSFFQLEVDPPMEQLPDIRVYSDSGRFSKDSILKEH